MSAFTPVTEEGWQMKSKRCPRFPPKTHLNTEVKLISIINRGEQNALPEHMRVEVIEEQRRLVRARQQPPACSIVQGVQEINPEFLAAMFPNIQDELLVQQRLEQQRTTTAHADAGAPVDPSLRQSSGSSALSFSAFGQPSSMLDSPVINRSYLLTDKLLRLLSLMPSGQLDVIKRLDDSAKQEENTGGGIPVDKAVKEDQIQLAVEVLTSKTCSKEGLTDATALLWGLSNGGTRTRESILHLLLAGARQLGNVSDLLIEIAELKASGGLATLPKEEEEEGKHNGVMVDRFIKEAVVLTAPIKPKGWGELQLSSMTVQTNKTSSQSFFLMVFKVIIQLQEAVLLIKKAQKAKKDVEATKKEANLLVNKESEEANENIRSPSEMPKESSPTSQSVTTAIDVVSSLVSANVTSHAPPSTSSPMDVEPALPQCLESMSDQITITNWLKELANTFYHHSVLILQPTVEAFLLVHAAVISSEKKKKNNQEETRKEQFAHIVEKESEQAPHTVVGSEEDISPETKKFLAFTETHRTDGPYSMLVEHTWVLLLDIKSRYLRIEQERFDEGIRLDFYTVIMVHVSIVVI